MVPATGKLVVGGIREQTNQVIRNLRAVLQAGGLDLGNVVKTTVYMKDPSAFSEMNAAYAAAFPAPSPARAAVEVSALPKGAEVEIEAIARV